MMTITNFAEQVAFVEKFLTVLLDENIELAFDDCECEKKCKHPQKKPFYSAIENVIYQAPATIIFWKDGSKTIAKCGENDTYSKEKGFMVDCDRFY